jgi:hypothetical protein
MPIRELPQSEYIPRVLPDGWTIVQAWGDGNAYKYRSGLRVLVTTAPFDGRDWMHISVSREDRMPTWDDLKHAKSTFAGDSRYAYQIIPPAERHINLHPFCLHLWVPLTGEPPLPDFTRGGNTI